MGRPPVPQDQPLTTAKVVGAAARTALPVRRVPPMIVWGWVGGTIAIFVLILALSIRQSPNLFSGILTGLFVGLFTALLVAAGVGWALIAYFSPAKTDDETDALADHVETALAPTLAELEVVRQDVLRNVKERGRKAAPFGLGGAVVIWALLFVVGKDKPDFFDLVTWSALGGFGAYAWAGQNFIKDYQRLYKSKVLPALAAQFGTLTYRAPQSLDVGGLQARGFFGQFDHQISDDEIAGTYRGLSVSVTELRLERGSGDDVTTVFDGLLTRIALPRQIVGVTAVLPEGLLSGFRRDGLERVRLEDPVFEKRYDVFGSDQIAARALLTPAFLERFMGLDSLRRFGRPQAFAQDSSLLVLQPKRDGRDFFKPPSYLQPAHNSRALIELSRDIETMLALADTVINLDAAARSYSVAQARPEPVDQLPQPNVQPR